MLKNRKKVFDGRIISVETATAHLPNGLHFDAEIVRHPGGAAVVALNEKNEICLLNQYRCVFGQWVWELPAGKIDHAEPPLQTARRELEEEAGIIADHWQELGHMISSPGVFSELVYLYFARDLRQVQTCQEDHEVFDVHWIDVNEAIAWANSGKISDAKSVVALYRAMALTKP